MGIRIMGAESPRIVEPEWPVSAAGPEGPELPCRTSEGPVAEVRIARSGPRCGMGRSRPFSSHPTHHESQ